MSMTLTVWKIRLRTVFFRSQNFGTSSARNRMNDTVPFAECTYCPWLSRLTMPLNVCSVASGRVTVIVAA